MNTKSQKHRQFFSKVGSSELLKKYRLNKFTIRHLPFDKNRTHSNLDIGLDFRRRVQRNRCVERLQEKVKVFLERDDNSRTTAGKKETVTQNKIKKQKTQAIVDPKTYRKVSGFLRLGIVREYSVPNRQT